MKFSLNTKIIEPENNNDIRNAVILLHGYGGDGKDISMLTLNWKRFLKNTVFLCPDAKESCAVNPAGYQWFDLSNEDPKYILEESKKAEIVLLKFLEEVKKKYNLKSSKIILSGFSQGCMISFALSINFPKNYKKAVGLSGKIPHEIINFDEKFDYSNHNFFCSHGVNDQVIPIEVGRESNRWFSEKNINHKYLEFESAHGINSENFEQMNLWLLKN